MPAKAIQVQIGKSEAHRMKELLCRCLVGWFGEASKQPLDFPFFVSDCSWVFEERERERERDHSFVWGSCWGKKGVCKRFSKS